jgi:hypothetical protein
VEIYFILDSFTFTIKPLSTYGEELGREGWPDETSTPSPPPSPIKGEGVIKPLASRGRGVGERGLA